MHADKTETETRRLKRIAADAAYTVGIVDEKIHTRLFHVFSPLMADGATLEIGPADGIVTPLLLEKTQDLTVLEPTETLADALLERHPQVTLVRELIEHWTPPAPFRNIFLMHVLEHVENAGKALRKIREWMAPNKGRVFISVPNAMSLHRQLGVELGILAQAEAPSERDLQIGHRRVYTQETLHDAIECAGLSVIDEGGVFIKIGSHAQIEQWKFSNELLDGLIAIGEKHPAIASDIYAVAEHNG